MSQPVVTFLSPCYNHSRYVIESLESIRKQTYPNIRHIIIDDCSTDDSAIKIKKWIAENNYKCEFIQHRVNKGISYTLNESIELANGEFWTALATDDFIVPERTEKFVDYLIAQPNANMVCSDCVLVNESSEIIQLDGESFFLKIFYRKDEVRTIDQFGTYRTLLKANYIPSSIMVRRSVFDRVGKFDARLKLEDWDMWLRISRISKIEFLPEKMTLYRYHSQNSIKKIDTLNDIRLTYIKQSKFNLPILESEPYWKKFRSAFPENLKRYPNNLYLLLYTPPLVLIRFFLDYLKLKVKSLI